MNREFAPFVDPGSRAPELLHVNASTRHGRSLNGVAASDRYHSSLSGFDVPWSRNAGHGIGADCASRTSGRSIARI